MRDIMWQVFFNAHALTLCRTYSRFNLNFAINWGDNIHAVVAEQQQSKKNWYFI